MAWTTPRTWSVGEVPTASNFNTHVRDNTKFLYERTIAGFVNTDGSVLSGSLFTSVKNSTGDYTITFNTATPGVVAVACSPISGTAAISVQMIAGNTTGFNVNFRNASSTLVDTGFMFIAVSSV